MKIATATSIAENFRLSKSSLGVVLLRKRLDISEMSEAIRAGIREVVSIDDAASLVAACKRSLAISRQLSDLGQLAPNHSGRGKILMVFSAKGGSGKTALAINLAQALSMDTDKKVVLMDLDLQFGDIAISMGIEPKKTISDAISMQNEIDELATSSLLTSYNKNLDLLLAPSNPTDVEYISSHLISKVIENLRMSHDYLVIDTSPTFTETILDTLDQADRIFLMTTLDMPSIKNLKLVVETLQAMNIPDNKLEFILNRSDLDTGLNIREVEAMLGHVFSTLIPSNTQVPASTNRGIPLVLSDPSNNVSRVITNLAKRTDALMSSVDSAPTQNTRAVS
ncbi:unannotated protein [freshwater metagenome]|uniref:Unannotated protein n=1 Tax=freshwater metagenome TaxID=449393 RepID=A0A6J7XXV8_9ZZZZ